MAEHLRWYVGPVDLIATVVDGREVVLSRGEAVSVSAEAAAGLDAQPDNWTDRDPRTPVTVAAVLAEVGTDAARAAEALAAERTRGSRARSTLVAALEEILTAYHADASPPTPEPEPAGQAEPEITEPTEGDA